VIFEWALVFADKYELLWDYGARVEFVRQLDYFREGVTSDDNHEGVWTVFGCYGVDQIHVLLPGVDTIAFANGEVERREAAPSLEAWRARERQIMAEMASFQAIIVHAYRRTL
jgi:hypothetical protein